jgi:aspartyl-tRNA(Asn)/glutamyl-tRNA(Gln) amidotransferase subunit A
VSRYGVIPVSPSLDACGPLTRTVEDAALVLQAIAGADPRDPTSSSLPVHAYAAELGRGVRGLKIGIPTSFFFETEDEEVAGVTAAAVAKLEELGARVVPVTLSTAEHSQDARDAYFVETARFHRRLIAGSRERYSAETRGLLERASRLPESRLARAKLLSSVMKQELSAALETCDAIASPTCPVPAPRRGREVGEAVGQFPAATSSLAKFTRFANLTGAPAVSVPSGFTSTGMPLGLQLLGRPLEEGMLLRVAAALETELALVLTPTFLHHNLGSSW